MGMHAAWQRVAAAIGFDTFLTMWRILDAEDQFAAEDDGLRVRLRRYRSFQRQCRNEFVRELHAAGLEPAEIQRRLVAQFGEELSVRHVAQLVQNSA